MSKLFQGKFIAYLKKLRDDNKLVYPGAISNHAQSSVFDTLITDLYSPKRSDKAVIEEEEQYISTL